MALTLQRKAFCDIKSVAPSRYLTGLSTTSLCKLGLLTTLQTRHNSPFLLDMIIRQMVKDTLLLYVTSVPDPCPKS